MIFSELSEVYNYGVEYTITEFLQPFDMKRFTHKIPFSGVKNNQCVRYADYLIPLFYTAYECKNIQSSRIIKELLGMYLHYYGHFQYPESAKEEMLLMYDEEDWNDFHNYWGSPYPALTKDEKAKIQDIWFTSRCINRFKPKDKIVKRMVEV
jgi:hypothetical protein